VRVCCAGHVNRDVTLRVDALPEPDGERRVRERREGTGGSAANVARALADLGAEPTIVGSVGDDAAGAAARESLATAGVDTAGLRTVAGSTSRKWLLVDDDGAVAVLGEEGVNEAIDPGGLADIPLGDHCHLTGQAPETALALAERAADRGVPVSFDPGRLAGQRSVGDVLARTDLLLLTARERRRLEADPPADCTVVVKRGRDGALVETADRRVEHPGVGGPAVDTTGAGDAFAAGFIAARGRGADLEHALAVACGAGALAVGTAGARVPLSWDAIDDLLGGDG
jgi:ribokinase